MLFSVSSFFGSSGYAGYFVVFFVVPLSCLLCCKKKKKEKKKNGQASSGPPRVPPILVTLADKGQSATILNNARLLKGSSDNHNRIYIKKDVHPSIRREWSRLREVEAAEKAKPENVGCVIRLDTRERRVYKDDTVIDTWNAQFF